MRALFVSLTLAGVLVLFPVPAYPQSGVQIAGSVEDGTRAVLPGVTVTLIPEGADSGATSVTDQRGRFVFLAVAPGKYRVTADMKGFQRARRSITVGVTAVPELKFVLRVTADEAVTVTGITRQERRTDAAENADAANFDDDLLRALPLPSTKESVLAFISEFLSPAAIGTDEVSVVVDGAESGAAGLTIPIWAIRRAVVNKDPYSPEFRRPGKARIEIITLDGSRRHFHGGAAATIQNSSMDARNAFAATKPQLDVRLAEWSLGGPIHSALTFSTSGERLTSDEEALVNAVTPAGQVRTTVPSDRTSVKALARLDLRPAPSHTFTFRYDVNDDVSSGEGVGGFELGELAYNGSSRQEQVQFVAQNILSPDFVNSLRINLERENGRSGQVASRPMIIVQGAFSGGAQQRARSLAETGAEIQNTSTIFTTRHTIRFGGRFALKSVDASDASNFGGTFEFASLDAYAAGRPLVFTVNRGAPDISFTLRETDFFIQDEVQIRPSLSVMGGVRYDWQSSIDDRRNFAPRVAMALAPGSRKTVLRAGMGVFHERLPASVTERTLLYDGARLQQLITPSPSFPAAAVDGGGDLVPPSVWRKSPDLQTPFLFQASVSVEREVWRRSLVTLEYARMLGYHLFRARDINAPDPGTGIRPDSTFVSIKQAESTASMRGHALAATFRGRFGDRVKATVQYTLSKTRNDTGGAEPGAGFPFDPPANSRDLGAEWGPADYDQRHRFTFAGTADIPAGFRLSAILRANSAEPYDITTGFDDNADTIVNDRPAGITRNTARGPSFAQLDLRISKIFRVPGPFGARTDEGAFELNVDAFNALNRRNLSNFIGVRTSPYFGRANSARDARTVQVSAKYSF